MKVAIYQPNAGLSDLPERLSRLSARLSDNGGLDLVVCPELFSCGYKNADQIVSEADAVDGKIFKAVARLAREHEISIVYGYPETGEDGRRFNSTICVSAWGGCLANHRKRALPTPYEQDLFVTGNSPCVFTLDNGHKAALLICYEVEFPEAVRAAAVAGAEIVIVPTALGDAWGVVARQVVPTRAFENGVFLMYANYAGEEEGVTYLGESVVVSPMGVDLVRAGADEALITASIDFGQISPARERLPYLQDYKRLR